MTLRTAELEYLSAWAREEKSPDPYGLPAHQLQAAHQVPSVMLIRAIKAWARSEGKRDEQIFELAGNANPPWPWAPPAKFRERLEEILSSQHETGRIS